MKGNEEMQNFLSEIFFLESSCSVIMFAKQIKKHGYHFQNN